MGELVRVDGAVASAASRCLRDRDGGAIVDLSNLEDDHVLGSMSSVSRNVTRLSCPGWFLLRMTQKIRTLAILGNSHVQGYIESSGGVMSEAPSDVSVTCDSQ